MALCQGVLSLCLHSQAGKAHAHALVPKLTRVLTHLAWDTSFLADSLRLFLVDADRLHPRAALPEQELRPSRLHPWEAQILAPEQDGGVAAHVREKMHALSASPVNVSKRVGICSD